MTKRVGLYIGDFNPPHYGHQYTALYALQAADLEEVVFLPVYKRHDGKAMEDWHHRCNLTYIATFPFSQRILHLNSPDRRAWENGGHGLLTQTIAAYMQQATDTHPVLILNSMKKEKIYKYEDWPEIQAMVAARTLDVFWADGPNDISSKIIRVALSRNWGTKKFVPPQVKEYIIRNSLYKSKDCT